MAEIFECSCRKFADRLAFSNLGMTLSYAELDRLSAVLIAYLRKQTGLRPGGRITAQMLNVLQYPIVAFGVLRAGLVVANISPPYIARKVRHQFRDTGVRAPVYLNIFGKLVEEVLPDTRIEYLIEAHMGDLLSVLKGWLVNSVAKSVKKMVPDYRLPQVLPFKQALKQGQDHTLQPVRVGLEDVAVLQYISGTTEASRGATLTHGNLVVSILQVHAQLPQLGKDGLSLMKETQEMMIAPLPLCHIYAFTASCMCMMVSGSHSVLITNLRDIPGSIRELKKRCFSVLLGLSTLFVALVKHPGFEDVGFSNLKLTNPDGTALVSATTERWKGVTGYTAVEGCGLTECSPVMATNPYGERARLGTVGVLVVGVALKVIDEQDNELPTDEHGELCIKGPQMVKGYWQRPETIEEIPDTGGWLKVGDVAMTDEDGFVRIADRKKDLTPVSGPNIYPSEIEDVVAAHPEVASYVTVDIPDEKSGEVVKPFVMARDPDLSVEELKTYCKENLTGYKIPRQITLKSALPMTPVGEILRRGLYEIV